MKIVRLARGRENFSRPILEALPQWFGIESARDAYIKTVQNLPTLLCTLDRQEVGFLSLKVQTSACMEVAVLAVLPSYHRQGIGRALMAAAETAAKSAGASVLTVKTLSPSHPDRAYQATRAFYQAVGFLPIEELPGLWGPSNPCLLMAKWLA